MAVTIRLRRIGKNVKNRMFYRVTVIDEHKARDARAIEEIGTYAPQQKANNFKIDKQRFEHWLKNGAIVSDTVRTLVKKLK